VAATLILAERWGRPVGAVSILAFGRRFDYLTGIEPDGGLYEQVPVWTCACQMQTHPSGVADDHGTDLQEFEANGPTLGARHITAFEADATNRFQ